MREAEKQLWPVTPLKNLGIFLGGALRTAITEKEISFSSEVGQFTHLTPGNTLLISI